MVMRFLGQTQSAVSVTSSPLLRAILHSGRPNPTAKSRNLFPPPGGISPDERNNPQLLDFSATGGASAIQREHNADRSQQPASSIGPGPGSRLRYRQLVVFAA